MDCFIIVSSIKLVASVVQFTISLLIFCLLVLPIIERDVLKYLTKTVNLLIFLCSYISFCCIYYEILLLDG